MHTFGPDAGAGIAAVMVASGARTGRGAGRACDAWKEACGTGDPYEGHVGRWSRVVPGRDGTIALTARAWAVQGRA